MADPITALIVGKLVATAIGKGVGAKAASLHVGGAKAHALSKAGDKVGDKIGGRVTDVLRDKPKDDTKS